LVSVQNAPKSNDELRDGTWMTVKLTKPSEVMMVSFHIALIQEEAPNVAKLLSLINKYLPAEHQVY
jgi:protoporphyrinogen oxidase